MAIVSVSLDKETIEEMNKIQRELEYSGRSEVMRSALKHLSSEYKQRQELKGTIDAILLIIHNEQGEPVNNIKHKYQGIVKTQIHNHLQNHKCLELFLLNGNASKINKMVDDFESNRKIEYVKLIVS